MFSKASNESDAVIRELQLAFNEKKAIIPFRIEDVPVGDSLAFYLSGLHWIDSVQKKKNVDLLLKDVKSILQNLGKEIKELHPKPAYNHVTATRNEPVSHHAPVNSHMKPNNTMKGVLTGAIVLFIIVAGIIVIYMDSVGDADLFFGENQQTQYTDSDSDTNLVVDLDLETLYINPALVGTWYRMNNVAFTHIFEFDGTGQRKWNRGEQIHTFKWGTRDGLLVLDFGPAIECEIVAYIFDGNILNLHNEEKNDDYFMFVPDQSLIGNWVDSYFIGRVLTFSANGTGYDSPIVLFDEFDFDFHWFNVNDVLIIYADGWQSNFIYDLSGDELHLTLLLSPYEYELWTAEGWQPPTESFRRGSFAQNPALIGLWGWNNTCEGIYYFGEYGAGVKKWLNGGTPIIWASFDDILLTTSDLPYNWVRYEFTVTENTLILGRYWGDWQGTFVRIR